MPGTGRDHTLRSSRRRTPGIGLSEGAILRGSDRHAVGLLVRPSAEELDAVGDDADRLAVLTLRRCPLAPVQPAVDRDRAALREVLRAGIGARAEDGDVEVVRLLLPLPILAAPAGIGREPQVADRA